MGEMGDETQKGGLTWRLLRNYNGTGGDPCLLKVAMKCWNNCVRVTRNVPRYAPEVPLVGLPRGGNRTPRYHTPRELADWGEVGLLTVGNCFESGEWIPFDLLQEQAGLPVGQFLQYESLKNSIRELWGGIGEETPIHLVLQKILTMGRGKHLITWIYRVLIQIQYICPGTTRARWERDIGL